MTGNFAPAIGGHFAVFRIQANNNLAGKRTASIVQEARVFYGSRADDHVTKAVVEVTLNGVNIEATVRLANALTIPVIASGGITNLDDVKQLCGVEHEGIMGAICGRSIYEGTLDFAKGQALADELNGKTY